MNSVLIIDDDKELCALMKKCVEQENLICGSSTWRLRGSEATGKKQGYLFTNYSGCDDARYERVSSIAENPREKQCAGADADRQKRRRR